MYTAYPLPERECRGGSRAARPSSLPGGQPARSHGIPEPGQARQPRVQKPSPGRWITYMNAFSNRRLLYIKDLSCCKVLREVLPEYKAILCRKMIYCHELFTIDRRYWTLNYVSCCKVHISRILGNWSAFILTKEWEAQHLHWFSYTDKKKRKFSLYTRNSEGSGAKSYMTNDLLIYGENICAFPHIYGSPFLIYDFAPDPIWISLYMRKILLYFFSV